MFNDPPCLVKCAISDLRLGRVKNPMFPSFYGKGYIGVGKYGYNDKSAYKLWIRLLQRSYSAEHTERRPSYEGVTVCEEWLNFQNFAEWCYRQEFFNAKDDKGRSYHLDKDILLKGNKTYSPETCCFVPRDINNLIMLQKSRRGKLPIGVCFNKQAGNFKVILNIRGKANHVGHFDTVDEAFQAYKKAKEAYVVDCANEFKGRFDDKVYQALLNYKVDIND